MWGHFAEPLLRQKQSVMAKRGRKKRFNRDYEEKPEKKGLNPETKKGILIIFFFAGAALLFLSLFHLAGTVGTFINNGVSVFFGISRFLIPLVLILLGTTLLFPEKRGLRFWNFFGIFLFFLCFTALINILFLNESEQGRQLGGYLGQFFAVLLPRIMGFWAALIFLFALLLISFLLIFNTSLQRILFLHPSSFWPLRRSLKESSKEDWEDDDEEEEWEETEEETMEEAEEMDEEAVKKTFIQKPIILEEKKQELVLTSHKRRKIKLSLDLLEYRGSLPNSGDIEKNKTIIQRTLDQFGIEVEMGEISVGPTVTQYTLRPAQGIKLSRIIGLQNDLALALAAHPIRIEAPIPGKSLVGIEIPNQRVALVSLRELLESKIFQKRKTQTELPLGKDVSGKVWSAPLEKMPHLLVAGATGSGKSVCLNTLITSLLYQNGPDDLKLILVDPKRVELTVYAGTPHLLVPPITKLEDTVNALKWTVREMERRLDVLSSFGVRDIASFNEKAQDIMPRIVVIIDELADLMAASGHEIEATVVRIAQMARAVGIHLILATQRPSVDVITGTIKANFPSRIAFAVASQTDSRTILDISGAEKLLGRGDMLFTSAELSKPKRLQGAFISESEIGRIVEALKKEELPDYNYAITEKQTGATIFDGDQEQDTLFKEAVEIVLQSGKASTSFLQRRLKIGYSRAARIMDQLEEQGVIGQADGSHAREVLMDEWPEEKNSQSSENFSDQFDEGQEEENEEEQFLEEQEGEYPEER